MFTPFKGDVFITLKPVLVKQYNTFLGSYFCKERPGQKKDRDPARAESRNVLLKMIGCLVSALVGRNHSPLESMCGSHVINSATSRSVPPELFAPHCQLAHGRFDFILVNMITLFGELPDDVSEFFFSLARTIELFGSINGD